MSVQSILQEERFKKREKEISEFVKYVLSLQTDPRVNRSILMWAIAAGEIVPGWKFSQYIRHAAEHTRYETVVVYGRQGAGKSNWIMRTGYMVYRDWDKVLNQLIFTPEQLVDKMLSIPEDERFPWIGWDDINVHMPSSIFRTDIETYGAVDSALAAIRTKCSVLTVTIPRISRLPKNVKDNITFEVFIGRNQLTMIRRYVMLPGIKRVEENILKVVLEPFSFFNLYEIPIDVWRKYWRRRLQLTTQALLKLKGQVKNVSSIPDPEEWVPIEEAAEALNLSLNTLRNTFSVRTWNRMKFIRKSDLLFELKRRKKRVKTAPAVCVGSDKD